MSDQGNPGTLLKEDPEHATKVPLKIYETEMYRLQTELAKLQRWVKQTGARIVIIFEGRDAAGKGGTIKRLTEYLSPRVARVVALPTPTEREKTEWYFQRYIAHLPAAGEIVIFDRSWYNRAGVEKVMGFATAAQVQKFMQQCPTFERMLVEDGIMLRKYWFSVSDKVQYERFSRRLHDPLRQWKLSPMDLESISRWEDYSRAKDEMLVHTDTTECPWYQVPSDSKKAARLNMISHFLSTIPYKDLPSDSGPIELPSARRRTVTCAPHWTPCATSRTTPPRSLSAPRRVRSLLSVRNARVLTLCLSPRAATPTSPRKRRSTRRISRPGFPVQ